MVLEYLAGLFLLGVTGLIIGMLLNFFKHSGGSNEGAMIEGAMFLVLGQFISMVTFLFLGLRDSGAWLLSHF